MMPPARKPVKRTPRSLARKLAITDADLAHPEVAHTRYLDWLHDDPKGRAAAMRFSHAIRLGPLGPLSFLPDLAQWALQSFSLHGAPDSDWHPVDAYLEFVKDRLSPEGKAQFARWKAARLAFWEILETQEDVLLMREWDLPAQAPIGEPMRAVRTGQAPPKEQAGELEGVLGYLAPWDPPSGLHVLGDYAVGWRKDRPAFHELLLSFRHPEILVKPLPWYGSRRERERFVAEWRRRDWPAWFSATLHFPFNALVVTPRGLLRAAISDVLPSDTAMARQFGVYFRSDAQGEGNAVLAGATATIPVEVGSVNWAALQEYWEYRAVAGPPAGIPAGEDGREIRLPRR